MDRLAAIQEALDNISLAADMYQADDPVVEIRAADITAAPTSNEHGWIAGRLQRILLDIAVVHADDCPAMEAGTPGCDMCQLIRTGLVASLVSLQGMRTEELELRFGSPKTR